MLKHIRTVFSSWYLIPLKAGALPFPGSKWNGRQDPFRRSIDSGDMAYLSKRVREQLDEAGYKDAKIYASNDLDEKTIMSLKMQSAKIDVWGVGTKLITAFDQPALGAVYKMVSIEKNGQMEDTIKLSNNAEKVSTPGRKQVWRITKKDNGKSEGTTCHFGMEASSRTRWATCSIQLHLYQ